MLNHLFATILICLGVAKTTPISNYDQKESNLVLTTPKKSNIINNYTLDINPTNRVETAFNYDVTIPNTYYPISNQRYAQKYNIQNNNSYLNVMGNVYINHTKIVAIDDNNQTQHPMMIENKEYIGNNLDYNESQRTEILYIYKLTPYNYNENTEITVKTVIGLNEWENNVGVEWYIYESYFIRNIYIQTEPTQKTDLTRTWDQYINQQITEYQPYNIARDIENVNNGFFYTKQQDLLQIGYNSTNGTYVDEINIGITPFVDNYIVIEYIPTARAVNMGAGQNQETMIPLIGTLFCQQSGNTITGTNIIPEGGNYEVIDIPGIMFDVLTMPFAFVSQAFNLTLFPGTPYQINISNLFLSVIAIIVFVWLIKTFMRLK